MTVTESLPINAPPEPFTPIWWATRLHNALMDQLAYIELMTSYSRGYYRFPMVEKRISETFKRILGLSAAPLTGLIVDATSERLAVEGFRFGDVPDNDEDAWGIWQASDFDAQSQIAIHTALVTGKCYASVAPNPDDPQHPILLAEDPAQVIIAYEPGTNQQRSVAALKVWIDEWTGRYFATLYTPDYLLKLQAQKDPQTVWDEITGTHYPEIRWEPRMLPRDDVTMSNNPLGAVPFVELRNRPGIDGRVMSEIEDQIASQDRANHILLNAMIAAEYGAFRQKWAAGIEVPRDPATGNPVEPFDVAVNRILIAEDSAARFGDFNATDLKPYIDMYESTVLHMAATSRVPASYLLGRMVNLSAEALAAGEAGLVKKCGQRALHYESAFENLMRLAFRVIGDPRQKEARAETVWSDMAIRSEAQSTDAAVKKVGSGIIPIPQAQEDLGYTQSQRTRMEQWQAEQDAMTAITTALSAAGAPGTASSGIPTGAPAKAPPTRLIVPGAR